MVNKQNFTDARRNALDKFFSRLNDMQRMAVFTVNGPLLILAGAGSGKTSVLVNRIENMVRFGNAYADNNVSDSVSDEDLTFLKCYNGEKDDKSISRLRDIAAVNPISPWSIMAITFTNKAAGELKSRLTEKLGEEDGNSVAASTFHSMCVRILRREIDKLGYEHDFTIYDSDDSQRLLKSCYEELDISDKTFPPRAVLSVISSSKDKLVTPEIFEGDTAGDFRKIGIAKLYKAYQAHLKSANALDFDDIISLTVKLFEEYPDVLNHYSNRYKYIMVDEYQDTNYAQLKLVTLLANAHNNICVVGDDDQSIYKFRGATIENILKFEEQFNGAAVIRLEQNYRSTQNILNAANSVISNNTTRNTKKLWTDAGDGEPVTLFKSYDEAAEARFVASEILDGVSNNGRKYSDFAVLYRMNAQSNSLERAFTAAGIQYRVIGGQRFYDRKEIRDIISYLSVLDNDRDMLRFKRIVNEPKRGIGDTTVSMIEQMSNDLNISPLEIMRNAESYPLLSKKSASLAKVANMFAELSELSKNTPIDELLDILLDRTGYEASLKALGEEGIARLENVNELKSTMSDYMKGKEDGQYSLSEFLEEVSLYTDVDKLDINADAVNLMTIHSAKGLEFPIVFIVGMEDGIFPGVRSMDNLADLEEERRLAYVAITRAKEKLYITHAQQRMLFGSTNRNLVSRFVKEIPAEYIKRIDSTVKIRKATDDDVIVAAVNTYTLQNQIANHKIEMAKKNTDVNFAAGERVKHNIFGEGTIISVKKMSNDAMLEVAFDNVGTKKLMANFAKIQKI